MNSGAMIANSEQRPVATHAARAASAAPARSAPRRARSAGRRRRAGDTSRRAGSSSRTSSISRSPRPSASASTSATSVGYGASAAMRIRQQRGSTPPASSATSAPSYAHQPRRLHRQHEIAAIVRVAEILRRGSSCHRDRRRSESRVDRERHRSIAIPFATKRGQRSTCASARCDVQSRSIGASTSRIRSVIERRDRAILVGATFTDARATPTHDAAREREAEHVPARLRTRTRAAAPRTAIRASRRAIAPSARPAA